jgi:hypothetical protein
MWACLSSPIQKISPRPVAVFMWRGTETSAEFDFTERALGSVVVLRVDIPALEYSGTDFVSLSHELEHVALCMAAVPSPRRSAVSRRVLVPGN